MRELMDEVKMGAVLQFPPVRLRAEELAGLSVGSVLRLPIPWLCSPIGGNWQTLVSHDV